MSGAFILSLSVSLMDFVLDLGDQDLKEYTLERKYMLLRSGFKKHHF